MANSITVPLGGYLNANGYYYQIIISYKLADSNTFKTIPNSIIDRLEIDRKLNKLDIDVILDLTDISGELSKIFKQKFVLFNIYIGRYNKADTGNTKGLKSTTLNYQLDYEFKHDFILDKFHILNRAQQNAYTYRFKLVSAHAVKLNSIIRYSNWDPNIDISNVKDDNQTDIIAILQNCANACGVPLKLVNSNNKNKLSKIKIKYCTSANDNFYSIFDYLIKRLYFYPNKKAESLWFVTVGDNPEIPLELIILNEKETFRLDTSPLIISAWDTGIEKVVLDYINFAVVNKLSIQNVIQKLYPVNRWEYSLTENKLKPSNVTSEDIINYSNSSFMKGLDAGDNGPSNVYLTNTKGLEQFSNYIESGKSTTFTPYNSVRSYSYSNTMPSIYDEQMSYLLDKNAIVVNAQGDLKRRPGFVLLINKQNKTLTSDDPSNISVQNLKEIYAEYSGEWIIESVNSVFSPKAENMQFDFFRQNIVMFRDVVLNGQTKKQ